MKYASKKEHTKIGDIYVSLDGDPQPFWLDLDGDVMTLANDGTIYKLDETQCFPAKRIHKNYRNPDA